MASRASLVCASVRLSCFSDTSCKGSGGEGTVQMQSFRSNPWGVFQTCWGLHPRKGQVSKEKVDSFMTIPQPMPGQF